jgi:hypothetical protein
VQPPTGSQTGSLVGAIVGGFVGAGVNSSIVGMDVGANEQWSSKHVEQFVMGMNLLQQNEQTEQSVFE